MIDAGPDSISHRFDPFGVAAGVGVVLGALSLVQPWLALPTATFVALALATWASRRRAMDHVGPRRPGGRAWAARLGVCASGGLFLFPPAPWVPLRALALGGAAGVLWLVETGVRRRPWSGER